MKEYFEFVDKLALDCDAVEYDGQYNAKLTFGIPTKEVFECNLNEEKRGSCEVVNNSVDVRFDKWQIKTFMVL